MMRPVLVLFALSAVMLILGILSCGGVTPAQEINPPPGINPDPSVNFPQQEPGRGFMEAQLFGELVLDDNGSLRVGGALIIWRPGYFVNNNDGLIEVWDENGEVVVRVGEEVYMGGGYGAGDKTFYQGGGTRLNLNFSSDLFSLEVITAGDHKYYILTKRPPLDELAVQKTTVTGKLVTSYDNGNLVKCPHMTPDYTPIWPSDYQARVENGVLEIVDGAGQVVVRDGEEVSLEG
ncbi:MAG: hypothetical protein V3S02_03140, partial [Dehalococcoidales bacterium]